MRGKIIEIIIINIVKHIVIRFEISQYIAIFTQLTALKTL